MFKRMSFGVVLILWSLGSTSAESFDRGEPRSSLTRQPRPVLPVVSWSGRLQCESVSEDCDPMFVRESDSSSYDVETSENIIRQIQSVKGGLRVRIHAKKTPKFLFWGNVLVVHDIEKLSEKN